MLSLGMDDMLAAAMAQADGYQWRAPDQRAKAAQARRLAGIQGRDNPGGRRDSDRHCGHEALQRYKRSMQPLRRGIILKNWT